MTRLEDWADEWDPELLAACLNGIAQLKATLTEPDSPPWSDKGEEMQPETLNAGANVMVRISPEDFEHLTYMSSERPHRDGHGNEYPGRFFDYAERRDVPVDELDEWRFAYWIEDYAHLLLARAFLAAIGERFLITSDEYVEPGEEVHGTMHHTHGPGWVIFTDYAAPHWKRPLPAVSSLAAKKDQPDGH